MTIDVADLQTCPLMSLAATGQVAVMMDRQDGQLRIEVRDEGVGFDLAAAAVTSTGGISSQFGLFSIRERMHGIGGMFGISRRRARGRRPC